MRVSFARLPTGLTIALEPIAREFSLGNLAFYPMDSTVKQRRSSWRPANQRQRTGPVAQSARMD
jgi:hypothetical protein